jgi:hypothetical protein
MTPRWVGLTAPFHWLIDAVDVGRHQPAVIISAILITAAVGFLPSLPLQLMTMAGSPPGMAVQLLFQAIGFLVSLAISPVLVAGIYRLLDGAERGQPVAVAQIGDGFRDGSWGPIVGVTALGYVLVFALVVVMMITMAAVAGLETLQSLQQWMSQVVALQAQAEASGTPITPDAFPKPPEGLGRVALVALAFAPLWVLVALGLGWALVSVALLGGLRAAALNALPVFVLLLALLLPGLIIGGLFGLVMGAAVALASLLGPLVAGVVTLALVLAFTVVASAISYGFTLGGWRAACDDGAEPSPSGDRPGLARIEA